jgi:hypothetical protein
LRELVRRYFAWISPRAATKRRQRLTFSIPEGRQQAGFAGSLSWKFKLKSESEGRFSAPEGRQPLAVGDECSEVTHGIHQEKNEP